MSLEEEVILLRAKNLDLRQSLADLTEKFNLLLNIHNQKSVKKDSHNSSLPPSSDLYKPKTKSLREPSEVKSGGQEGHTGSTLEMRSNPDKFTDLKSSFCSQCGTSLIESVFTLKAKRQVIEIPPIIPIYEEFRQYACKCHKCEHEQVADFPVGVTAPIQYGSSVESLLSYLSVYQYVPFARLQNLFTHVFSLPLSQGTINNILERTRVKCDGVYKIIKNQIAESPVVGSDETGAKVNGKKWWIWVWQNMSNTFIVASDNRGYETIENVWKKGLPNAILVADRWAAQLKTNTNGYQICLAHLLRNIIFLDESEQHPFAAQFKKLIADIFKIRKELVKQKTPYKRGSPEAGILEQRLNDLLLISIDKQKYHDTHIYQMSMLKHRESLLPCVYNLDIPPDNNGSERAIRNVKVKQKVSGQFKTGQDAFCVIRSVIDTLRKREVEILPTLAQIVRLQPFGVSKLDIETT
jgi:transposase